MAFRIKKYSHRPARTLPVQGIGPGSRVLSPGQMRGGQGGGPKFGFFPLNLSPWLMGSNDDGFFYPAVKELFVEAVDVAAIGGTYSALLRRQDAAKFVGVSDYRLRFRLDVTAWQGGRNRIAFGLSSGQGGFVTPYIRYWIRPEEANDRIFYEVRSDGTSYGLTADNETEISIGGVPFTRYFECLLQMFSSDTVVFRAFSDEYSTQIGLDMTIQSEWLATMPWLMWRFATDQTNAEITFKISEIEWIAI